MCFCFPTEENLIHGADADPGDPKVVATTNVMKSVQPQTKQFEVVTTRHGSSRLSRQQHLDVRRPKRHERCSISCVGG